VKYVGEALKAARERAGLTQNTLARRVGMTAAQVSQVESGRRVDPQFSTVARLAKAVGISLDEIAALSGFPGYEPSNINRNAPETSCATTEKHLLALERALRRCEKHVSDALASITPKPVEHS
jgi:transcriptional regulator with XRE-family HTH domain